jgi:hypothetical protein
MTVATASSEATLIGFSRLTPKTRSLWSDPRRLLLLTNHQLRRSRRGAEDELVLEVPNVRWRKQRGPIYAGRQPNLRPVRGVSESSQLAVGDRDPLLKVGR